MKAGACTDDHGLRYLVRLQERAKVRLLAAVTLYVVGPHEMHAETQRVMGTHAPAESKRMMKASADGMSMMIADCPFTGQGRVLTQHYIDIAAFFLGLAPGLMDDLGVAADIRRAMKGALPVRTSRRVWTVLEPFESGDTDWMAPQDHPRATEMVARELAILAATDDFALALGMAAAFRWAPGAVSGEKLVVINAMAEAAGDLWASAIATRGETVSLVELTTPLPSVRDLLTFHSAPDDPQSEPGATEDD